MENFAVILIYCSFLSHFCVGEIPGIRPKITVFSNEDWQNITHPAQPPIYFYFTTVISPKVSFSCQAPYPIQWNITGYIPQPHFVTTDTPKRDLAKGIFSISGQAQGIYIVSFRLSCEMVGNHLARDEVLFFGRWRPDEHNPFPIANGTQISNSKVIPCSTTNPLYPVTLHKLGEGQSSEILINSSIVSYDLVEGFKSDSVFDGLYICRQRNFSVNITAVSTLNDELQFAPSSNNIYVLTDTVIRLECFSKSSKNVHINVIPYDPGFLSPVNTTLLDNGKFITEFSFKNPSPGAPIRLNQFAVPIYYGKAKCFTSSNNTEEMTELKEWRFQFFQTPELYMNNKQQVMECDPGDALQNLRCKHGMNCNLLLVCLKNSSECNNVGELNQYYTDLNGMQKVGMPRKVRLPYTFLSGVVQCSGEYNDEKLAKRWEYFTSLDSLKYTDWTKASKHELLRLDMTPPILHTNDTTRFICMGVQFLFSDSLYFELEYKNGSTLFLEDDMDNVTISSGDDDPRKINGLQIIQVVDVQLPLEAVGIRCVAPWWNSTDVMVTSTKFETRHLFPPKPAQGDNTLLKETFYFGEKRRRLKCFASGEPKATYSWYFNGSRTMDVFPELQTSLGDDGTAFLEFPEIEEKDGLKYAGEYECVAVNKVGNVTQTFEVNVSETVDSDITATIVSVSVVAVILIVLLVTALLLSVRRYRIAKEMLRNLSDAEIDEFFDGKPEILQNLAESTIENVDFLPYNKGLEIPLNDLQFNANLLGTGNFAFVVRALILSKGKPVALKISKPSTDVTLFKSLLSEVKIMSYIGNHENVLALVGVCTEGIKSRSIYIATDICGLGCLTMFLRKNRATFFNICDNNQESIPNPNEGASLENYQLTTLDLINFSAQIAKGMEYLAHKSVIHADLATRNVLLTCKKVAKISDFGLSKKLYEDSNYTKKSKQPLPWRWMALESLQTLTFSTSSDIWSYGVTLYEIFTLGDTPYPNESWNVDFVTRLENGMRMGRPLYSTQEIYCRIISCWEKDPKFRPSFTSLREYFEKLCDESIKTPAVNEEEQKRCESRSTEAVECSSVKYLELS